MNRILTVVLVSITYYEVNAEVKAWKIYLMLNSKFSFQMNNLKFKNNQAFN